MFHRHRWIGLLILAALLLCACQPVVAQPDAVAQPSDDDVTAAINAIFTEYGESLAADDAERWIQLWVEDGVQLPPGAPPNIGRDVIFAGISGAMEQYGYRDMDIQVDEVLLAGDLAIARGVYTVNLVPRDGGDPILVDGKYTTTFQRQPDGSLKIYRDIFNSNVPPAAAPVTDVDAVTEAINANWREYEASQLAGDPDRWIALWAEDGVQLPPGSPPVVGKEAIDAKDRADLAANDYSEFVIDNKEVEVNGDLAFSRGNFKVTVAAKSGGDPMHFEGKYMTIFRQQPDGTWKIYRDTFNSSAP